MPFLDADRARLLMLAEKDVRRWCCPPEEKVLGRYYPDTHWLRLFEGRVSEEDAHRFLVTFQLTNRQAWDKPGVATAIMATRAAAAFDPLVDIARLAGGLPARNARPRRHSSAASKIATFTRPEADIFIWDRLASKAARHRDWHRGGRTGRRRLNALYRTDGQHDYPSFWYACDAARADERGREDFCDARDRLIADFRRGAGGRYMAERIDDGFVERRLLDKLMFAEGQLLEAREV